MRNGECQSVSYLPEQARLGKLTVSVEIHTQYDIILILSGAGIHGYTVELIWIGHAPFREHTYAKRLV